jgi:hypothetical protein
MGFSRIAPGIARAPGQNIRAGDYRASRQIALRTRRRSTCRRTTSSGSVTVISTASHVTTPNVQAMSGMWTVRSVTSVGMLVATCGFEPLFPLHVVAAAPRRGAGRVSALPDPVEQRLGRGRRRRLMLAVAPGPAGALLVVALPARDADHVSIVRPWCGACYRAVLAPGLLRACSGHSKAAATV